ncbi:MAG TPA: sulfite exporter TauE/SafE family protein [Burkholderiaceae bacterium]|nr:sulfite exporter TauE/SafE family protein [Burkholderiaceae bacterium]
MPRLISWLEPLLVAELLALGGAAGFLAGLLGVGGGMMMVPFVTFFLTRRGVDPALAVKMAIATSMATIVFTSISSLRAHHARGAVRWPIVRAMAPGIVAGGLLAGAGAFALIKGSWLAVGFALFVGYAATRMLIKRASVATRSLPSPIGQCAVGVGIGFLSALVGAGGAFMSVPFMARCGVPTHNAVATSAAIGLPIALASTAGYIVGGWSVASSVPGALGYVVLPMLALIAIASISTAPLGARAAHASDVSRLSLVFAGLLYSLAAYMVWRGVTAP